MAGSTFPYGLIPPDPGEAEALARVAAYLARAGTAAASRLLAGWSDPGEAALLEDLRDSLLAGAALCDGILDLVGELRRAGERRGR